MFKSLSICIQIHVYDHYAFPIESLWSSTEFIMSLQFSSHLFVERFSQCTLFPSSFTGDINLLSWLRQSNVQKTASLPFGTGAVQKSLVVLLTKCVSVFEQIDFINDSMTHSLKQSLLAMYYHNLQKESLNKSPPPMHRPTVLKAQTKTLWTDQNATQVNQLTVL